MVAESQMETSGLQEFGAAAQGIAVLSSSPHWNAILGVETADRSTYLTINETELLFLHAPDTEDRAESRSAYRKIASQIRERNVGFVLVLCSGQWTESAPDLIVVEDHVNWTGDNPLIGMRSGAEGERFLDMTGAYDSELRMALCNAARETEILVSSGVAYEGRPARTPGDVGGAKPDTWVNGLVLPVITARQAGARVGAVAIRTELPDGTSIDVQGLDIHGLDCFAECAVASIAALPGV